VTPIRKILIGGALSAAALGGGAVGAALINGTASAQSPTTTTDQSGATASTDQQQPAFDPTKGGHVGANGVKEELLTGDTAEKAKAAALAAVPDGTIQRVETDAEGAVYEAHMVKSDGTHVTVKMDADFNVTGVETGGPGGGPGGGAPGAAQPSA
jgi:uncharacterized membrane protein YkoI